MLLQDIVLQETIVENTRTKIIYGVNSIHLLNNKIINDGTAKIVSQTEGLKCIFNFLFQYQIYFLQLLCIAYDSNSV